MKKKKKGQKLLATCLLKFLKAVTQHFNHTSLQSITISGCKGGGDILLCSGQPYAQLKKSTAMGEWTKNEYQETASSVCHLCSSTHYLFQG